MERYFHRYPGVAAYMERTREAARSRGYVETVFGRRLWLPEIRAGAPARRRLMSAGPKPKTRRSLASSAPRPLPCWMRLPSLVRWTGL